MEIFAERLYLSEVTADDIIYIHTLNSFPEVDEYNTLGILGSIEETEVLVNAMIADQSLDPQLRYVFVIRNKETGNFCGLIGLVMGKPKYKSAEIWHKIYPQSWNKGYATEVVKAVLAFGFNQLQLHRIEAGCATENLCSIKVLEKSGFTREGHARKLLPIRGQWVDNFGYAILEDDFKLKNELNS